MKILKDSAIYLFGEMFAKALPFLLLPYLTRKLGVAGFGELAYYQTFFALLVIVFSLSQDGAVARYYYVYGKRNLHNVVYAGYVYTITIALFALIIAWAMHSLIMAAVVCAAAAQCVLAVQLSLRQCQKQAISYTIMQMSCGIIGSILTVMLLEWTDGLPVAKRFVALFVGNIMVSLSAAWYFFHHRSKSQPQWRKIWQSGQYVMAFGLPLLLHHGSGFIKGQLDRMVLYPLYPAEQIGIYAAGFQVAMILSVLLMSVNKALVPYYYQAIKDGSLDALKVRRFAKLSMVLALVPAGVGFLLPESLFLWFLGDKYIGVKQYIVLFLVGFGLTMPYFILVNYLFYYGRNTKISAVSMLSAVGYLIVLMLTAPLGTVWTPWAMIAGNAVILPLLFRQVKP